MFFVLVWVFLELGPEIRSQAQLIYLYINPRKYHYLNGEVRQERDGSQKRVDYQADYPCEQPELNSSRAQVANTRPKGRSGPPPCFIRQAPCFYPAVALSSH